MLKTVPSVLYSGYFYFSPELSGYFSIIF